MLERVLSGGRPDHLAKLGEVLRILAFEDLPSPTQVRPGELVESAPTLAQLEERLPQAKVEKGIPDRLRAEHRFPERVQRTFEVAVEKVSVADRGQKPRRRAPLRPRLGEKVPGQAVGANGVGVLATVGLLLPARRELDNPRVDFVGEFQDRGLCEPDSVSGEPGSLRPVSPKCQSWVRISL